MDEKEMNKTNAYEPWEENQREEKKAPKKKGLIIGIIIAVVVLALIAACVFVFVDFSSTEESAVEQTHHHINAHGYPSWSVHFHTHEGDTNLHYYYLDKDAKEITMTADEVNTALNEVVASCGEKTLDNRTLQYFYGEGTLAFYNEYYSYLSYMLDTSAPTDSQINSAMGNGTDTWQKTFLDSSLENFYTVAAMCQEAEKSGYTLTEDDQAYLDTMLDMETLSMYYGYPDAVTLLKEMIGPMANEESYVQYITDTFIASAYTQSLADSIEVTDAEIEEYYDKNTDVYAAQNIQKIDENVMNVRHILIQPEAAEDGSISEEAWAAAEAEANRIWEEWKAGEATEDTFAELATTYSTDTGSSYTGGLYENVYPGQMVAEFNDWCFDDARQTGDSDIVKTTYGYHIMYYVSEGDYIYWQRECETALLSEKVLEVRDQYLENYETSADYGKIIILDAAEATTPSAQSQITDSAE